MATKDYCAGHAGLKRVAARHNVDVSSLRKWIAAYRAHGEEGLRTRTSCVRYSAEFKSAVVERMRRKAFHSVRSQRSRTFAISISLQCGSSSMMTAVWPRDVHGLQPLP
ncbi:helix-turn-helix domain-containing protein [Paraburkholderia rhynchosiae]